MSPARWIVLAAALVCSLAGVLAYHRIESGTPAGTPPVDDGTARRQSIDSHRLAIAALLARRGDADALLGAAAWMILHGLPRGDR